MYTLRNKSSKNPIITFKKPLLDALLKARPESASLAIAKHLKDYKLLTSKDLHIDYEQKQALLAVAGADDNGMWPSKYSNLSGDLYFVVKAFTDGLLNQSPIHCDISDALRRAELFFDMIDKH